MSLSVRLEEVRLRSRITHWCCKLLQLDTDSNIAVVFTRVVGLNDNLISWISVTDKEPKHLCGSRRMQNQSSCVTFWTFSFLVVALQFCDRTWCRMGLAHTRAHALINDFNVFLSYSCPENQTIRPGFHMTLSGRCTEHTLAQSH